MGALTISARFRSQEQAESAVRKLRALRGDCFRIECHGDADAAADSLSSLQVEFAAESDLAGEIARPNAADSPSSAAADQLAEPSFTLSASIPDQATDQAHSVIAEAGGQVESARAE